MGVRIRDADGRVRGRGLPRPGHGAAVRLRLLEPDRPPRVRPRHEAAPAPGDVPPGRAGPRPGHAHRPAHRAGRGVIGAMGLHTRTGELLVVRGKGHGAGHRAPGPALGALHGVPPDLPRPQLAATAWPRPGTPGAEFARLEESSPDCGPLAYIAYGVGNAHNTWHGCPIVDANGREVPWVDRDGQRAGERRGALPPVARAALHGRPRAARPGHPREPHRPARPGPARADQPGRVRAAPVRRPHPPAARASAGRSSA